MESTSRELPNHPASTGPEKELASHEFFKLGLEWPWFMERERERERLGSRSLCEARQELMGLGWLRTLNYSGDSSLSARSRVRFSSTNSQRADLVSPIRGQQEGCCGFARGVSPGQQQRRRSGGSGNVGVAEEWCNFENLMST
ncbi:hypothetical protein CRG98_039466 [Punica granatum]|uniref:Uncharacterized protein n=1 Tax=Punica granatum TaxID=22663 RepID=A0A2I0I833_PUNGR|nr:hypothetical protein CRG98_039466 [Punica granatum]